MPRRILVIEDDRDALANLQDILELDGYSVGIATSIQEAKSRHSWSDYDVVLSDRKLPDGSADTILPEIQQAIPQPAVIIITGYTDFEGVVSALRAGASDYLLKPVEPELLRAAIKRVLTIREMETRIRQAERLASLGQMITALSHESRNALGRCQSILELLTDEMQDDPERLRLAKQLQKAHSDLHRLYEEVRNYAAPITLDRESWSLATIWRQAWTNSLVLLRDKQGARMTEKIEGINLTCDVDNFRMDQVFRNLFENSLAACPEPACIEVSCAETRMNDRPAIEISVRDNGPGLTREQSQRVFDAFYTTKHKGTGLGMAIVKRVVEAHGGTIAVGESASPGAEFVLTLPRGPSQNN